MEGRKKIQAIVVFPHNTDVTQDDFAEADKATQLA